MNKKLSIIIPSFNREKLLKNSVDNIVEIFKSHNFLDYEIIVVVSGQIKYEMEKIYDNVYFYYDVNRLNPGIARNLGIQKAKSDWIWFVDDDDEICTENLLKFIELISIENSNIKFDIIAHSLKRTYTDDTNGNELLKNVLLFKEKQEVFNYIISRELLLKNNILFSDGLHEDIRYVVDIINNSKEIKFFDFLLYKKITREDSITKKLNSNRIDGYLNAINEIRNIKSEKINVSTNDILTQCLGTILYLINKSDNKSNLIDYLDKKFTNDLRNLITKKYTEKNTNFKYATSLYLNKKDNEKFIEDLNHCFSSYISCKDLKNSIFLGPKEIIGCCKRFFYKGKMKGDIVLMPESNDVNLDSIIKRKREVEDGINSETYEPCEGCPYLERYNTTDNKINYVSLENFTYCNMRCTYCSPKYYGGKEALYDTYDIISNLIDGNYLDERVHIVWGGGEPTLKPKFKEITEKLLATDNVYKIRVLSNSLKFSKDLYDLIKNEKIRLVTSIDAGTQDVFKEIRGKGNIISVMENLKAYKENIENSENLTIKYILTEDNHSSYQLTEFVNLLKQFEFQENFIQISCNFLLERPTNTMIYAIYELAARLLQNGFNFVYFDDLIRDRLKLSKEVADDILLFLEKNNLMHSNILSYKSSEKIILWGTGYQSLWIKNHTTFGKSGNIIKIISNENDLSISEKLDSDIIIAPVAVQELPEIYKEILKSKLSNKILFPICV